MGHDTSSGSRPAVHPASNYLRVRVAVERRGRARLPPGGRPSGPRPHPPPQPTAARASRTQRPRPARHIDRAAVGDVGSRVGWASRSMRRPVGRGGGGHLRALAVAAAAGRRYGARTCMPTGTPDRFEVGGRPRPARWLPRRRHDPPGPVTPPTRHDIRSAQ